MERSRYINAEVWKVIIIAATCQLLAEVLYKPTFKKTKTKTLHTRYSSKNLMWIVSFNMKYIY